MSHFDATVIVLAAFVAGLLFGCTPQPIVPSPSDQGDACAAVQALTADRMIRLDDGGTYAGTCEAGP